jgi:IclR family acetate operon transcriptional repressor
MPDNYIVQPVAKALQVLECVAEEGRELALTEICYKVQLPKTTVFRYLHTLRRAGFIAYDPQSDRYRIGVRLWALGQSASSRNVLCTVARPIMKALRDRFNETVNLAELEGREVVYLEIVESRRSLRMQAKIGGSDPAYSTAVGKALLAFLPEADWPEHLPDRWEARTPHTLTSFETLRQELGRVQARGYALDRGENEEGCCCVGAPIFHPGGQVIASLSLSAPESRVPPALESEIARGVVAASQEISARLRTCRKSLPGE